MDTNETQLKEVNEKLQKLKNDVNIKLAKLKKCTIKKINLEFQKLMKQYEGKLKFLSDDLVFKEYTYEMDRDDWKAYRKVTFSIKSKKSKKRYIDCECYKESVISISSWDECLGHDYFKQSKIFSKIDIDILKWVYDLIVCNDVSLDCL